MRGAALRDRVQAGRWGYAHGTMRGILAGALGVAPSGVVYGQGQGGKPCLPAAPELHFSLTHSGAWAGLALARGFPVGLDLEEITPDLDWAALLEEIGSPGEIRAVRAQPEPSRRTAFYRLWVRKEAVLKAIGVGLGTTLALGAIDTLADEVQVEIGGVRGHWRLYDLAAPKGYVAALSLAGRP